MIPRTKWDKKIQTPPTKNQITFMVIDKPEFEFSITRVSLPNGHKAKRANFKVCKPKGIPIMLTKSNRLEIRYSRSEEHTSELQSRPHLVCRLLLEKKKNIN